MSSILNQEPQLSSTNAMVKVYYLYYLKCIIIDYVVNQVHGSCRRKS